VAVAHFKPAEAMEKNEEQLKPAGSGTPLGDIEYIKEAIDKKKSDDDALTKIHGICYGKPGQKASRKKALRAFNGFASASEAESKVIRGERDGVLGPRGSCVACW